MVGAGFSFPTTNLGLAPLLQADVDKLAGAHGDTTFPGSLLISPSGQECSPSFRQHNCSVVSCSSGDLQVRTRVSLSQDIIEFCQSRSICLVPRHLSGDLNVLADRHSRKGPVGSEWSLDAATFQWLCRLAGPFQIPSRSHYRGGCRKNTSDFFHEIASIR